MTILRWGCWAICTATLMGMGLGCVGQDNRAFTHADVTMLIDVSRHDIVNKTKRVDAATVQHLASFFPGVGKGRKSDYEPLALDTVKITFCRSDGATLSVGSNYCSWTEGHGSFPVKGDLRSFIESLFQTPASGDGQTPESDNGL